MEAKDATTKRLRVLLRAASDGPWAWKADDGDTDFHGFLMRASVYFADGNGKYGFTDADAAFIATVRNELPDLLDRLDLLERVADAARTLSDASWPTPQHEGAALRNALAALDAHTFPSVTPESTLEAPGEPEGSETPNGSLDSYLEATAGLSNEENHQ